MRQTTSIAAVLLLALVACGKPQPPKQDRNKTNTMSAPTMAPGPRTRPTARRRPSPPRPAGVAVATPWRSTLIVGPDAAKRWRHELAPVGSHLVLQ